MTYSSQSNAISNDAEQAATNSPMGSTGIGRLVEKDTDAIIPPQAPTHYDVFTNPLTGALYYYIRGGDSSYGANKNLKNSWVFNPPGKEFYPNPPWDPEKGNLWVDRNNAYLTYVYNNGESTYGDIGWMALTSKKRAYDYFVLQLAADPDTDLENIIANPNKPTYSIYKQGYIYYNVNNLNLYVWNGEVDEWGVEIPGSSESDAWVSITQHELTPDPGVQSTFTMLKEEIAALEADVAALKAQASA